MAWPTELNAATAALIRVLKGGRYGFSYPVAIAVDGTRVWVVSYLSDSVTELNAATGAPLMLLAKPGYRLAGPCAIAPGRARVWVTNCDGDSVTEFPA